MTDGEDGESDDEDSEGEGSSDGEELEIDDDGEDEVIVDSEGDEQVWIDEGDEEGHDEGEQDEADFFDQQGAAPIRDEDDEGSEDSENEEEMYLAGERVVDAEMTEQFAAQEAQGAFGWDSLGNGEGASGRRNRLIGTFLLPLDPSHGCPAQSWFLRSR